MSEIQVVMSSKGSESITRAIQSFDEATGRSAQAAKANAAAAQAALDSQIVKQKELTQELLKAKDALADSTKGTDEYKALRDRVRDLTEAQKEATAGVKQYAAAAKDATKDVALTANSVDGLKARLTEAKRVAATSDFGSAEFAKATKSVKDLESALEETKAANTGAARSAAVHKNSVQALEQELSEATAELRKMDVESDTFRQQKKRVDQLASSMDNLNKRTGKTGGVIQQNSSVVSAFTTSLSSVVGGIVSVGAIVNSLRADLEKLQTVQENSRLSQLDFEQVAAAQAPNLKNDLTAAKEIAKAIAGEKDGFGAAVNLDIIGNLKSSGARTVEDAGNVLRATAKVSPFDAAGASELGKSAVILANALNTNDFESVIGLIQSGQSAAVVTNVKEFAEAFGNNINAAILNQGLTAEQAIESAVKFNRLNPNASEAATQQKGFFNQLSGFKTDNAEFNAANTATKITILQSNEELRKAFVGGLREDGRDTIKRLLAPGEGDAASFKAVDAAIPSLKDAKAVFDETAKGIRDAAPFAFADKDRQREVNAFQLKRDNEEKLAAEARKRSEAIDGERTGFGASALAAFEGFGSMIESAANAVTGGSTPEEQAQDRLRFQASNLGADSTRELAQAQLRSFETLAKELSDDRRGKPAAQPGAPVGPVKVQVIGIDGNGPREATPLAGVGP